MRANANGFNVLVLVHLSVDQCRKCFAAVRLLHLHSSASSAQVRSLLAAANFTFALKAELLLRRLLRGHILLLVSDWNSETEDFSYSR